MKKIAVIICLLLTSYLQNSAFAETDSKINQGIPKTLIENKALLVQCYSYSMPGTINGPTGTLTVAGLLPSDPHLTVTLTILWGNPITGTLHGVGKRTSNGVTGKIEGALYQFGGPKSWITSEITAIFPTSTTKGTLTMTNIGDSLDLTNGCSK